MMPSKAAIVRITGGIVGPVALIATWARLGYRSGGYSPVADPISRLAATGASTQAAMTVGLVSYAAGIGLHHSILRDRFGPAVGHAALLNAVATLGIAATPLDSVLGGSPHVMAAGLSYASLAAIPLLAAPALRTGGHRTAANLSVAAGIVSAGCLGVSATDVTSATGLLQRAGLTAGHLWLIVTALQMLAGPGWRARAPLGGAVGRHLTQRGHYLIPSRAGQPRPIVKA